MCDVLIIIVTVVINNRVLKETLVFLVQEARPDPRERRDHVDQLDLMVIQGQRVLMEPRDLLDHLVIQPRESSTEERKTLIVSRTLRRYVCYLCVFIMEKWIIKK